MPTLTNLKVPNRVPRKRKHGFLQSLFFMIIILITIFFLLQSSFFNIKNISVKGNKQLDSKEMVTLSGLSPGVNIFKANLLTAEKNIKLNPLIKEISLKRKLPNEIVISILEREPIGLVSDQNRFIEVDGDGIYLAAVDSLAKVNYPIITGDKIAKARPGEKASTDKIDAAINYLVAIPKDVRSTISEIHVTNLNQINIYTIYKFQVRLGGTDKIKEKGLLYRELIKQQTKGEKLDYIDIADVDHPAKKPSVDIPPSKPSNIPSTVTPNSPIKNEGPIVPD